MDSTSALQAKGLGCDPRQRHEPHKLIYLCYAKFSNFSIHNCRWHKLCRGDGSTSVDVTPTGIAVAIATVHTATIMILAVLRVILGCNGKMIAEYLSVDIATNVYADTNTDTA